MKPHQALIWCQSPGASPTGDQCRVGREHIEAHALRRAERILLVAPQPFYESRGTPIAVLYILRALSELGYAIDFLTYPMGKTIDIPGVRYVRIANPLRFNAIPVSFSFRKVFLDIILAAKLAPLIWRNKYLYIHAVEEAAFLVVALRPMHRAPILYDMASSLPEQLALKWYFRARPIASLMRRLERWLLSHVDLVVASAGLRTTALASANARVREWQFPAEIPDAEPVQVAALRTRLDIPDDAKVILYTGTFEAYQGIPQLVASVPDVLAENPSSWFVLVGARSEREVSKILKSVGPPHASRVRVLCRQDKEQLPRFYALADILVSPRSVGDNIPLKIFDYLATGKPIVATDIAAHRAVLTSDIALIVPASKEGLASGMSKVLSDPILARRLSAAGKAYAEARLSWHGFVSFVDEIARLVTRSAPRSDESTRSH